MPIRRSPPWKRWRCRHVGHDWGTWTWGIKAERRDCERCGVREIRYDMVNWQRKRWFCMRTLILGRIVEWHA